MMSYNILAFYFPLANPASYTPLIALLLLVFAQLRQLELLLAMPTALFDSVDGSTVLGNIALEGFLSAVGARCCNKVDSLKAVAAA